MRAPVGRHVALDRVCHGVHAGRRGDRGRQRARGLGIENRQPREQGEVGDLELHLALGVLDHRGHRDLAAGARRRGNAGKRRDVQRPAHAVVLARHQEEALLLGGAAAVGEDRVGHLRGVHHRAAADGQERVGAGLLGGSGAALDHVGRRVLRHLVEDPGHLQAAVGHAVLDALDQPGAANHLVGDHEDPPSALLLKLEAGRAEQVAPGDDPSRGGVLVEVLEAAQRGGVEGRAGFVHQAASSRSWRPCSSSCLWYRGNTGFTSGTSLRILATGPFAFIWPRASATVTFTLPSQKRWAVSASIVMTTSGSMAVSPQSTWPSSPSISLTVICESGARYWYWTMVFAFWNLGESSSSSARSSNSLPMVA